MVLPIRPEDYGDPNWCPDCGEMRGICRCEERPRPDWNYDDDDFDPDEVCPYCNGTDLDLDGDSGGGCTHCINGRKPR